MRRQTCRLAFLLSLAWLLAACAATPVPVRQIAADKHAYLQKAFAPDAALSPMLSKFAGERLPSPVNFKKVTAKLRMDYEGKEKSTGLDFELTVYNVGDGLRQELWDASNNGVPHGLEMKLSYLGLIPLKFQIVYFLHTLAPGVRDTREIKTVTPGIGQPKEGATYQVDYTIGSPFQAGNYFLVTKRCTAGKPYAANSLHAEFSGQAVDLNCDLHYNEVLRSKHVYSFLYDYSMAFRKQTSTSESKETLRFLEVVIH